MTDPIEQATNRYYFEQEEVDKAFEERAKRRDEYIAETLAGTSSNLETNRVIFYDHLTQLEALPEESNHKAVCRLYAAFQAYLTSDIDLNAQDLAKAFKNYLEETVGNYYDLTED